MSLPSNDPPWIPSPWLQDISDEMAATLSATLHALAMACEDHYSEQLLPHYRSITPSAPDPQRPWIRDTQQSDCESSLNTEEARAADFNARQLDLFRPGIDWHDEF